MSLFVFRKIKKTFLSSCAFIHSTFLCTVYLCTCCFGALTHKPSCNVLLCVSVGAFLICKWDVVDLSVTSVPAQISRNTASAFIRVPHLSCTDTGREGSISSLTGERPQDPSLQFFFYILNTLKCLMFFLLPHGMKLNASYVVCTTFFLKVIFNFTGC